ncbi:uncharacterized protein LOC111702646 [Eurytemora carolleeae]|uniref:uncharacterized protein LOC111702646 n=1 Tax=Eurytemora carolleeae TaxID=1294199 RepID=UPI000C764DD1|nr:uncharacterized protein LOC111702646 [Eurytemora carolleeae]|eukprot:XP_023330167.1 uncharacterized protein LOC111702646 [Eurytemora affinis]
MMSFIDVMQFLLIIGTVTSDQETELKRVNAPSVDVYSSNLSKIISYLTTTMMKSKDCIEIYERVGSIAPNGNQKVHVDDLENVEDQITLNTKCYILITDKANDVKNIELTRFSHRPKLVIIVSSIPQEPNLRIGWHWALISTVTEEVKYRNANGHFFKGIWSNSLSTLLMKKVPPFSSDPPFRVTWNIYMPRFELSDGKADVRTSEGYYLQTFIERRKLNVEYLYMNGAFGAADRKTGIWNGAVGVVGYGEAELGVSFIGYTIERMNFALYSTPVGEFSIKWVSKYPGRVGSRYNLAEVFDVNTWIATVCSIVGSSLVLVFLVQVRKWQGFRPKQDNVLILLTPMSLITNNGAPEPDLFATKTGRVLSGSILILFWALVSFLLVSAFSCNLSAVLMRPTFEAPIESSQQIVEQKKVIISSIRGYIPYILGFSSNPWDKILLETNKQELILTPGFNDVLRNIQKDQVFYLGEDFALHLTKLQGRKSPLLYFGKETIRPYYTGWIMENGSRWEKDVNMHIMQCNQAGFDVKLARELEPPKYLFEASEESLTLEHLVVPLYLLGGGGVISILVLILEILWNRCFI